MGKAIGLKQLANKKYKLVEGLSDDLKDCIGEIEDAFTMMIWGHSGQGKTNFTIRIVEELSRLLGTAAYDSLEEGHGKTMQDLIVRHNLIEKGARIIFIDNERYDELFARLKKKKSPKIVVIDSIQYSRMTYEQYQHLKETFKRKVFIFISHATGSEPKGSAASSIKYDVNIKIRIEGFIAFITSRYGGTKNFVIWEQGARAYWGKQFNRKVNKLGSKMVKEKEPKHQEVKQEGMTPFVPINQLE